MFFVPVGARGVFSLNETFSRCRRPIIRMAGEAAGCVEHTERVQLQWHCEGVDENSAALACEGVDENARAWTKTRGNPDSCIGACQQRDEFLTGELFLPSRTANQYLARYWFAVATVKIVHRSEIHHSNAC